MTTGWDLSRKMMPYVRKAIGRIPSEIFFDIETASFEKDTKEATDLVLKMDVGDMAVRIRGYSYGYHDNLPLAYDWSVRFVANGHRTEIDKLREGFGRWYFMALSNSDETDLFDFGLIDLEKCRSIDIFREELWEVNPNYDGTAGGYLSMRKVRDLGCVTWYPDNMKTPVQSTIHWPTFPPPDDHPTWPREQYEEWIKRKAGTPEQNKRYAQAIAWYEQHP